MKRIRPILLALIYFFTLNTINAKKIEKKFAYSKNNSYLCIVKLKNNTMEKEFNAIITAKTIKGTSFVGIRNYQNKNNEVSNQTLLVGYDYLKLLKKDKEKLLNVDIQPIIEKYGEETAKQALNELLTSLDKLTANEKEKQQLRQNNDKTINRSDAQINAYIKLAKGVKLHKENKILHITGLVIRKQVLKKGEYKKVNSRPKTLAKREINKLAGVSNVKVRTFIFKNIETLKMQGIEI